MTKCSVKKCVNNSRTALKNDGVSYFWFPRNPIRCSEWTSIIAKDRGEPFYKPYKGSVVCSKHFLPSDIYTTVKGFRRLTKNAKPILDMSHDQSNCSEDISNLDALEESIPSSHATTSATQESVLQGESSSQQTSCKEDMKTWTSKTENVTKSIQMEDNIILTNCIKDMKKVFDKTIYSWDNQKTKQLSARRKRKLTNIKLKNIIDEMSEVTNGSELGNPFEQKKLKETSKILCDEYRMPISELKSKEQTENVNKNVSNMFKSMHNTLIEVINKKQGNEKDELDLFGRYFAVKLRTLPQNEIDNVMCDIIKVFLKHRNC